jgi:NTP pyrophosphatase (non-canonical NTP hydrolase)
MSIFSNSSDGYDGFPPRDPNVLASPFSSAEIIERDGLFTRHNELFNQSDLALELLTAHEGTEFNHYQYWAETSWKTEQGTKSSARRFIDKLREETLEFQQAIEDYRQNFLETDEEKLKEEVILEAGDIIWCLTALSCNARADIDAGARTVLFKYVRGTRHIVGETVEEPSWRNYAGTLATKYGQLTLGEIDGLIDEGFEPSPSPVMNVINPERDEYSLDEHLLMGSILAASLALMHEKQYGYAEENSEESSSFVMQQKFDELGIEVAELASQLLVETLYIVKKVLPDVTLAEIVSKNVTKLSKRVETQTIDKQDGTRD